MDLGQVDASPNILTNDSQLTNFTSQFPTTQTDASHIGALAIGPEQHPYSPLTDTQGPVGIQSSVLASKYLYQVPQRKAWGTLITCMLVADLVFLRALWLTFTLAVGMWMKHKYHDRDFCEDCRKRKESRSSTAESEPEYAKVRGGSRDELSLSYDGNVVLLLCLWAFSMIGSEKPDRPF